MHPLIAQHRDEIERLCRKYRVRSLAIFGSSVSGNFDPSRSDVDFLVCFPDFPPGGYADAYFGLLEDLQNLLKRPVDLVEEQAIENPYFRQAVDSSRVLLYAG